MKCTHMVGDGRVVFWWMALLLLLYRYIVAVVVHGRLVGWDTYVGGWWMGRWVVLYLRA